MKKYINYKFSVCIPTYNGAKYIGEALKSVLYQTYRPEEIIISDDCSTDNTEEVVKSYKDKRIKFHRNSHNLGCGDNFKRFKSLIAKDCEIMYTLCQDDILSPDAILKANNAFNINEDIGAVTRPYYQFDYDPKIPVRYVPPPDSERDIIVSICDDKKIIERVIEANGLLSALAYKVKYMDINFHSHVFPTHVYPLFSILKKHKIVFLHDYVVAVRIFSSQARFKSSIYDVSPVDSWVAMFNTILKEERFTEVRRNCIDYAARNYVGLVQIKNYGSYKNLIREIFVLLQYRWINIFNVKFWFYSLICFFTPRWILIKVVDGYKNKVLSKIIKSQVVPIQIEGSI